MWAEILQQISMCTVRERHEISQWVIKGKITPLRDRTKKGQVQEGYFVTCFGALWFVSIFDLSTKVTD